VACALFINVQIKLQSVCGVWCVVCGVCVVCVCVRACVRACVCVCVKGRCLLNNVLDDTQARRNGCEGGGGTISRAERAKKFFLNPPPLAYLGGT